MNSQFALALAVKSIDVNNKSFNVTVIAWMVSEFYAIADTFQM